MDEFMIETLGIEIHCPYCGNELAADDNSLPLAESPAGVMFECGVCARISQWKIFEDPPSAEQVPVEFGGTV